MSANTHKNAQSYLKEFAEKQNSWLKALIYDAINTNGNIAEYRKDEIFECLLQSKELDIPSPVASISNQWKEISILEIKHLQGVNALKNGEILKLNENVTVLYGLNGSGKSGYFKILNQIVGGTQKKEILPNIHSDSSSDIEVEIKFKIQNTPGKATWNGGDSLLYLNNTKVFDASYLDGLLGTRKSDEALIQPLGLHLFPYIALIIDSFKSRLDAEININFQNKPNINIEKITEHNKQIFSSKSFKYSPEQKLEIEKLFSFSEENKTKLIEAEKEISELRQVDSKSLIQLETRKKTDVEQTSNYINELHAKLSTHRDNVASLINRHHEKKINSANARRQFEAFKNIPSSDSKEWKEFIIAGKKYADKIESGNKNVCLYCWQPLVDENSINLIKSYSKFLIDKSQQELQQSTKDIEFEKRGINSIQTNLDIDDGIKLFLEKIEPVERTNLYQCIVLKNKELVARKNKLLNLLNDLEKQDSVIELPEVKSVIQKLDKLISNIESQIRTLSSEQANKQEQINNLEIDQKKLLENQSIHEQEKEIKKWFYFHSKGTTLKNKTNSINTRGVTELSKKAHNNLLTERLKVFFDIEINKLSFDDLSLKLEPAGSKKGEQSIKLVLTKSNHPIRSILSEGEQKAVALSMFIAEVRMQENNSPIILDDPVNSLDHNIATNFAEMILELDNQIIIFTHNNLFLNNFETTKKAHICKNYDSGCNNSKGKHIHLYTIQSEGQDSKGVIVNRRKENAEKYLNVADNYLNETPFSKNSEVAINIRKSIEFLIDEVIFNNQTPTKFSSQNNRINWSELRKIKNSPNLVNALEKIHSRVSGGELHSGLESKENPIEKEEFCKMVADLKNI